MTIKHLTNHEAIQKLCHMHRDIFNPIRLYQSHFVIFTLTFPVLFTKNNNLWNERKEDYFLKNCSGAEVDTDAFFLLFAVIL